MAQTKTSLTLFQASERFDTLSIAAQVLKDAIEAFKNEYDCDTVGLDEWAESIDEVLSDIEADIDTTFESDEE